MARVLPHARSGEEWPNFCDWAERRFYIPETKKPIILYPHQRALLDYGMDPNKNFTTLIYSTIKKSGKTAIAGAIGRYLCEHGGHRAEVLCVANDKEQAQGRAYKAILSSIELDPRYDPKARGIPGEWKIIERHAVYLPTNSVVRAISNDNKGEAGSNPVATLWTELWGYTSEASKRLFAELTPVNTRERSMRIIETYAGYEDESELLWDQYKLGTDPEKGARRLTTDELAWPYADEQPPCYVNPRAGMFTYWDVGLPARRMSWQQDEKYYDIQKASLQEHEYKRLHFNEWQTSKNEFIPMEWWDSCHEDWTTIPPLERNEPCVLGVDGSVNGASTALVLVSRHPAPAKHETDLVLRRFKIYHPWQFGGEIDLQAVENDIRDWCKQHNIVQVAYDQFQLHQMMTNLTKDGVAWCKTFGQLTPRNVADKAFYDLILRRRIHHDGSTEFRTQVKNCSTKNTTEDKMRIVPSKNETTPVDAPVACSMACHECLRLNI